MSISRWLAAGGVLGSVAIGVMLRAAPNDSTPTAKKVAPTANKQDATVENNKAFHAELLKIAAGYKAYGRVDDLNRWAPKLCLLAPSRARFSKSDEAETHGEKLYFLFAKDLDKLNGVTFDPLQRGDRFLMGVAHFDIGLNRPDSLGFQRVGPAIPKLRTAENAVVANR